MNVTSLYPSTGVRLESVTRKDEGIRSSSEKRPHLRKVTDELILSKRARAVLDEMRSQPDVDNSIRSGMEPDQLSEQRIYEVNRRLTLGYYREPHVVHRVASSVAGALVYER